MGTKRSGGTPESQKELPGVLPEVVKIASVTRVLKELKHAKEEYQKAGLEAKDANQRALALFKEHKLTSYKTPWGWVLLDTKEKLKFEIDVVEDPEPVDGEDVSEA